MRRLSLYLCVGALILGCGSEDDKAAKSKKLSAKGEVASAKSLPSKSGKSEVVSKGEAVDKGKAVSKGAVPSKESSLKGPKLGGDEDDPQIEGQPGSSNGAISKGPVSDHKVTELIIEVKPEKENGKSWDAFKGKPDIAVCVTDGDKTTCYPSGESMAEVTKPQCKDELTCSIEEIPVKGTKLKIEIVDTDAADNDLIGSGECSLNGSECTLGSATVYAQTPRLNKDARAVAEAKRQEESRKAEEAAEKIANPDRPDYPVACAGLDMKYNVKIKGAEGDLCMPNNLFDLVKAGVFEHEFNGSPSKYSDNNEFAILGEPQKKAGETSSLSGKERKELAKKTRSNIYWTEDGYSCSLDYVEKTGKLTGTCNWSNIYVSGSPDVSKKVSCENVGNTCPGRCSDDGDCDKVMCGCERSRCMLNGRCSRCPSERVCDEPEFKERGLKPWKFSKVYKSDSDKAAAKAMADSWDRDVIVLFRVKSHFRKLFYGKEDGQTKVQYDSGYKLKIQPLAVAYRNKKNGDILTVYSKGEIATTFDKRWKDKKSTSVTPVTEIQCSGGACTVAVSGAKK